MKTAKKQFLASVVSLMLCVAMLVGTTFAWFTDSAGSTNNIIKSGNLDVELEYLAKDENTGEFEWTAVEDDTALINNDAKWEPGHAEVVYLKASNLGELALKYQLGVNIVEEVEGTNVEGNTFKLSDYIYMGLAKDVDGKTAAFADRKAAISAVSSEATLIEANSGKGGELYPVGNTEGKATEAYFALVIYMPETVGNVANYKKGTTPPELQLGVNIAAIQLAYEGDDFTDKNNGDTYYDNNLNPAVTYVSTAQELYDALMAGKNVSLMNDIDMSGVNFSRSGNLTWKAIPSYSGTLNGNGYKITGINSTTGLFNEINGGTVKNLTIEATVSSDATAATSVGILANTVKGNVTIDNVTVSGSIESDADSVGGLIGSIEKSDNDDAVVTITNCTNAAAITTVSDDQNVGALVGSVNSNVSVDNSANEGTVGGEQTDEVLGEVADDVVPEYTVYVADAEALKAAVEAGYNVVVTKDISITDITCTVAKNVTANLYLNGKTISAVTTVADKNGDGKINASDNYNVFLVNQGGKLNIIGEGEINVVHTGDDMEWNAMTTIAHAYGDITVSEGAVLSNFGGTSMAFALNVYSGGNITVEDSFLGSTYCAMRAFNAQAGAMSVVDVKNSSLVSYNWNRAFWAQYDKDLTVNGVLSEAEAAEAGNTVYGSVRHAGISDSAIWVGGTEAGAYPTYVANADDLKAALASSNNIALAADITVTEDWDRRFNGANVTNEIMIDGMGHTLKFTGKIYDGANYHCAFRFEAPATVKNTTFDMSEVTYANAWLRVISATNDLTVDGCTFVGPNDTNITKDNAIMVGDTNVSAQIDADVAITNCTFTNWRRGVSDNENAKEINSILLDANTFNSANIYVSAYNDVKVIGNTFNESLVNITSYTNAANVTVTATGNTLDVDNYNSIGSSKYMFTAENVEAQDGFTVCAD